MSEPQPLRVGNPLPGRAARPVPVPEPADVGTYYESEQDDPDHPYGHDGVEFTGGDA